MAKQVQAVAAYSPKVKLNARAETPELIQYICERTGLVKSTVVSVVLELHEAVIHHIRQGRPAKLDNLGTYYPSIGLEGRLKVGFRVANELRDKLNVEGFFTGTIQNEDMIGETPEACVQRWNHEHPEDPVK